MNVQRPFPDLRLSRAAAALAAWVVLATGVGMSVAPTLAAAAIDVQSEVECLALNIYFEARGEPDPGKRAVAHVVMNRVASPLFPNWVCAVVRQGGEARRNRCQFSWWCDGRSDRPRDARAWKRARAIAASVYWGYSTDPTGGALWYHARNVRPKWRVAYERGPTIGRHTFYRRPRSS